MLIRGCHSTPGNSADNQEFTVWGLWLVFAFCFLMDYRYFRVDCKFWTFAEIVLIIQYIPTTYYNRLKWVIIVSRWYSVLTYFNHRFVLTYININDWKKWTQYTVCLKSNIICNKQFFITSGFIMSDLYIIYYIIVNTAAVYSGVHTSLSHIHFFSLADTLYIYIYLSLFILLPPLTIPLGITEIRLQSNTLFRGL